ncbi:hypothetical protein A3K69_04555 [Candidatus Bathyarchaeota archaeon RBG_16_57_9]|nr:MAG: hypothetical protein A3K69_04555 [Candidatus Bathyarchaeota archaeon RBG_16_57_9]
MKNGSYALAILAALSVTYFAENFIRSAATALAPILIRDLGLSYGAMGLLSTALLLFYSLMQVPSGALSGSLGPRRTILGFTALTLAGVAVFYIGSSYLQLFAAQLLIGLGCSVFYLNAVILVSAWLPQARRATGIGVLSAVFNLGNFAAYLGFPLAVERTGGWRWLVLAVGGLLALGWALNYIVLRDDSGGAGRPAPMGFRAGFRRLLSDPRVYPFAVGYTLRNAVFVFANWLPQYLMDAKGLTYLEAGQVASMGTLAGIPGCILVAALSDRLHSRKRPLLLFSVLTLVLLTAVVLTPPGTPIAVLYTLIFLFSASNSYWVLYFSMVPETLPRETASLGLGLVNMGGTVSIGLVTPIYGALVDATGGYGASNALLIGAAAAVPLIYHRFMGESYGRAPDE